MRPSWRGWMRLAMESTGRWVIIGGDRIGVCQSRDWGTDQRPCVRCLDISWPLKAENERKVAGRLAAAGSFVGEAQATLRAARHLL